MSDTSKTNPANDDNQRGAPFAPRELENQRAKAVAGDAAALEWLRKAAEQGNANAQYALGNMYAEGRGVARVNRGKALKWYLKAGEQQHRGAVSALARIYANGWGGIPKNAKEAAKWKHEESYIDDCIC